MSGNIKPSDRARVMATIDPDQQAPGAVTSDWVDASKFENLLAVVKAGVLGAAATLDAKLQQATDAAGTGAKDITGKAITQLTKAGADDDKQAIINCRADELDLDNSFTHVALVITVGAAASYVDGTILGFDAHYEPETDLASVDEIVS